MPARARARVLDVLCPRDAALGADDARVLVQLGSVLAYRVDVQVGAVGAAGERAEFAYEDRQLRAT